MVGRDARRTPIDSSGRLGRVARLRVALLVLALFLARVSLASAQQAINSDPTKPAPSDDYLFSLESPLGDIDYVVGRGLRLGWTGLTVGGFTTLEVSKQQGDPGRLELDSLNFLVLWEPMDFLRGFTEVEVGNLFSLDLHSGDVDSHPNASVERLYADASYSDALNARFGKFQTPVGIWNLVPAEPFTWTATDPVLIDTAFDEHQTGGGIFGTLYPSDRTLDYWIYGQFLDPLDPSGDHEPIDRSVGGRVRYGGSVGEWALGASFLASERKSRWNYLGGLDAFGRVGPFELQGEFAIVRGDIPDRNLWDVYLQGVYDLGHASSLLRSLHLVARYEHYDPAGERAADLGNVGLAWIPAPFLIVKGGYQFADDRPDPVQRGLFGSVSLIF
jgi:hypothetical protein